MKVFLAGATGAIGRPLISALIAAGHDVIGMTSSARGLKTLEEYGAEEVVANALDAQAVTSAMQRLRPEAVIEELTSLPKHYTPEEMRAAADRDNKLRLEGGHAATLCNPLDSSTHLVQDLRRRRTGLHSAPSLPFPPTLKLIWKLSNVY